MSGYSGRNRSAADGGPQGVQRSYATQLKEHEPLFNTYEHLAGLPRRDDALIMLRRIASLVKPIMRKRGWRVQILAEFLPPEQNLLGLNINHGFKICIRLRYHNNPDLFLPLEQVVDTMLHELSHNVWGEHDSNFHRLWDELRDEWETLTRKGYTGEGFLSKGRQLGGGHVPSPHEMRRLARASAEKRQARSKLTKGSGQKLGGTPLHMHGHDVRNIIADQVTRRNTINKGCGSGRRDAVRISDDASNDTFKTEADEDDANNRAIAQALYELMEEEENRKIQGTFADTPRDGGLAWHPENGLYDPRTEQPPQSNGNHRAELSEEDQMKWALQESVRSKPDILRNEKPLPALPPDINIARANSAPPVASGSEEAPAATPHPNPLMCNPPTPVTKAPPTRERSEVSTSGTNAIPIVPVALADEAHGSGVIDISDPFDPAASAPEQWTCEICTCVNPLQYLACDACGIERPQRIGVGNRGARPKPVSTFSAPAPAPTIQHDTLGWVCTRCGAFMEHKWWTCTSPAILRLVGTLEETLGHGPLEELRKRNNLRRFTLKIHGSCHLAVAIPESGCGYCNSGEATDEYDDDDEKFDENGYPILKDVLHAIRLSGVQGMPAPPFSESILSDFRLLDLPAELRNRIYELVMYRPEQPVCIPDHLLRPLEDLPDCHQVMRQCASDTICLPCQLHNLFGTGHLGLLRASQQLHREIEVIPYTVNTFSLHNLYYLQAFLSIVGPRGRQSLISLRFEWRLPEEEAHTLGMCTSVNEAYMLLSECKSLRKLSVDLDVVNMLTWRGSGSPRSVPLSYLHEIPHIAIVYRLRGLKNINIAWKDYVGLEGMENWATTLAGCWRLPMGTDGANAVAVNAEAVWSHDDVWRCVEWQADEEHGREMSGRSTAQ